MRRPRPACVPSCARISSRAPGMTCSASCSTGRPCSVERRTSSSGQASARRRARRRRGRGTIVISSGGDAARRASRRCRTASDRRSRARRRAGRASPECARPARERRRPGEALDVRPARRGTMARWRSPPTSTSAVSIERRARAGERPARPSSPMPTTASQGVMLVPPRISAFSAAAAMALPPRRPCSVMKGRPRSFAASAAFDSAAPTKPTGKPSTSAGLCGAAGDELEQPEQRGRRVADDDDRAVESVAPASSMPAAERVWPERVGELRGAGLVDGDVHRRSPAASRSVIRPAATMRTSQRIGAPAASAARPRPPAPSEKARSATMSGMPQAWTMRAATGADVVGQRRRDPPPPR